MNTHRIIERIESLKQSTQNIEDDHSFNRGIKAALQILREEGDREVVKCSSCGAKPHLVTSHLHGCEKNKVLPSECIHLCRAMDGTCFSCGINTLTVNKEPTP